MDLAPRRLLQPLRRGLLCLGAFVFDTAGQLVEAQETDLGGVPFGPVAMVSAGRP